MFDSTVQRIGMICLAAVLLCLSVVPTQAQKTGSKGVVLSSTFTSPQGFTLSYPSGWLVASKDQSADLAAKVRPYLDKLGVNNLNRMAVIVIAADNTGANANLNIMVSPGTIPANEETKTQMRDMLKKMVSSTFGVTITDMQSALESYAGRQTIAFRYHFIIKGKDVSQLQVYISNGDKTYIATCSCLRSAMPRYEPTFKLMLNSLRFQ